MPIVYKYDHSQRVLEVQAFGKVTVSDRAQFVEAATTDCSLPETTPVLIDVSGMVNAPTLEDIPKLVRLLERLAQRFQSRIAYFVTQVGFVTPYTLVSAQVDGSVAQTCAFTNRNDALKWLNTSQPRVRD